MNILPILNGLDGGFKMNVIDTEQYSWFLLRDKDNLYLDVNCENGFMGYTYAIKLGEKEKKEYAQNGHNYINTLANDINSSVPIAKDSLSIYKGRSVSKEINQLILETIIQWNTEKDTIS